MLGFEVWVKNMAWRTKEGMKEAVHNFFTDENGDTNFISIIVVLVIVLGLAALFREQIGALVMEWWGKIFDAGDRATEEW